jgi:hypothetical protein
MKIYESTGFKRSEDLYFMQRDFLFLGSDQIKTLA